MAPESGALRRVVRETVFPAGPRLSDVLCEARMLQARAGWLSGCLAAAGLCCSLDPPSKHWLYTILWPPKFKGSEAVVTWLCFIGRR